MSRLTFSRQNSRGFTLVELLIVIVVIAILAAITVVAYRGVADNARASALQADLRQDGQSLEIYKVTNGSYPTNITDANVKASTNGTTTYYQNNMGSYCLQIVNGNISYAVTSDTPTPAQGSCLIAGLIGWWKFDGNAQDSSGHGNNGTVVNATLTTGANGQPNSAYLFSGTNSCVAVPFSMLYNSPNLTYSAWINTSSASGIHEIIAKEAQYKYRLDGTGVDTLVSASGTGWTAISAPAAAGVVTGNWYNIVFTINSLLSSLSLYINGALAWTNNFSPVITSYNTNPVYIGAYNSSCATETFVGSIDDARIYNRALNADEISALYAAGAQ